MDYKYKNFFQGKNITIMGLGLLGRGLGIAQFLFECGANLTITDLKSEEELKKSVTVLKNLVRKKDFLHKHKIRFVFGGHKLEDFRNKDYIIKSAGVPIDSPYIEEAKKNKIPIEMDVSFFAKLSPKTKIIGVTGTRGKSMTTTLIYEILKKNEDFLNKKVYIGGNIKGIATLPILKKIENSRKESILVCELDSWQLQGFGESKISPHISVFTSFFLDHMNYYKNNMKRYFADKANIFKFQKKGDVLIIRKGVKKIIPKNIKSNLITVDIKDAQKYPFNIPGNHQRENLACAISVAKLLGVPSSRIITSLKGFKGVEGRLQYLKTIRGVKIYNDNNATSPEATMADIEALAVSLKNRKKNIILILGGSDKGLKVDNLQKIINKYCKIVILLPGTGTDKLNLLKNSIKTRNLKEAINEAFKTTEKGDILLFSPAFASFGMFKNEYDRGDQFLKIIKKYN